MSNNPDSRVDAYLARADTWQDEIQKLRAILLGLGLDESLKWGKPCYQSDGRNIAIIQPFKAHCALMFFKGALLEDSHGMLQSQGPNSRSAMRLEFTSAKAIKKNVVAQFVKQAVAVEREGRRVAAETRPAPDLPEELTQAFAEDPELRQAFKALTPGRQRGYVLHFSGAKQAKTRAARIAKCRPRILAGMGMHDR